MRLFECPHCTGPLFFANLTCGECSEGVEYVFGADRFEPLERPCSNRSGTEACNWRAGPGPLCASCALDTEHRPDPQRAPFQRAKKRVMRQLSAHGVDPSRTDPPLRFELAASTEAVPVTTGHADGLVTIDIAESDPVHRERVRSSLGEPYRTPLGHVRHEVGHWWWAVWIARATTSQADSMRGLFGDERTDYADALEAHYARVDDGSWREEHISFYASSHPFEDFAESFAHYLHMHDTLETAVAHGVSSPPASASPADLVERWLPLTVVLNELSRSMGTEEPYPFTPSPVALHKIRAAAGTLPGAG